MTWSCGPSSAGSSVARGRAVDSLVALEQDEPALADGVEMRASRDQAHVDAARREPRADQASDGAGAENADAHVVGARTRRAQSFTTRPQLLRQPDALHLAGRALGDLRHEHHAPRHLERRQASAREVADLVLGRRRSVAQHDGRSHLFSQLLVGQREGDRLRHRRMVEQRLVDLARRDLLAAAIDDLLEPPGQAQIAVLVDPPLIAGAQPPLGEGRGVRLRVGEIAAGHVAAADHHLPGLAGGQQPAGAVHDRDLGPRRHAHRARLARARRQRIRSHLVRRLGHAVGLDHRRAEHLFETRHHLRRERRRRRADQPQVDALEDLSVARRAIEHRLMDGGDRGVPGGARLLEPGEEAQRVEARARRTPIHRREATPAPRRPGRGCERAASR